MSTPTPAPTAAVAASYGEWWLTLVVAAGSMMVMILGVRKVMQQAQEKQQRVQKRLKDHYKRLKENDEFLKKNKYTWDWVLVFKVAEADEQPDMFQKKHSVMKVVTKLTEAQLETEMFYSVQQDEVYCKVRAAPGRLQKEADRIDLSVPLNPEQLKAICSRGRLEEKGWGPIHYSFGDGKEFNFKTEEEPFEGHYAAYDKERAGADDVPFKTFEEGIFQDVDRIKLVASIIEAPVAEGGCGMKIKDLTVKKACLAVFPLHNHMKLNFLQAEWLQLCVMPHNQPYDKIKAYFGEKIGLYFTWLGHYTKWLLSAAFVGFICWIAIASMGNNADSPSIPYFTIFMSLWATFYLESWKRTEKKTAARWGMIDFEQEQQSRPEFDSVAFFRESPVDGKQEKYFPPEKRLPVLIYSSAISSTFIVTVASAIVAIYIFKAFLSDPAPYGKVYIGDGDVEKNQSFALGSIIGSAMNAIQIMIMNVVYQKVALILTEKENHRTETAFEDALISKTFSFQFVNSFMALIYLAFIKQPLAIAGGFGETRCYPNCFAELNTSLGTIFISNILVGNLGEVLTPIIKARMKAKAESEGTVLEGAGLKPTDIEKQFFAEEYDVLMGTFKDYGEMVIQFGYCTLFVAAFPLAPMLAFVNNAIEIRVDAWKLCQVHRRPYAVGAEDIGTWFTFLDIMSTIAVVSNMALFVFTGSQLSDWGWVSRIAFFSVMEHVLLSIKFLIALAIPDVPEDVEDQQAREKFLCSKVIDNVADDEEDAEYTEVVMRDLSVKLTDFTKPVDIDD